jgi:OOP family OmpA-OmpF porin
MKGFRFVGILCGLSLGLGAQAADIPGSKDPPFLKRFEGSEIIVYQTKSYDEYAMATATSRGWEAPAKTEGAITRIMYRVPEGHAGLELLRNYEHALAEAGFALTYEFAQTDNYWVKGFVGGFFNQFGRSDGGPWWLYSGAARYVTAKATRDGQDLTVAVLVGESNGGKWSTDPKDPVIKPGEILVGVDVVAAKAVEIKMVEVKSETLAKALAETGKVDVYGILFDVDKTDIKPASAPTLEQVAKLLKDDPALKLEVAGHTDSTGDKDHNAKLSDGRADAVVQSLVKTYGIDAARLQAKGYGDAKPVAPNDTEDGRAKNRRVELRKM